MSYLKRNWPYLTILVFGGCLFIIYLQGFISDEMRNGWGYYSARDILRIFGSILIPICSALFSIYASSRVKVINFKGTVLATFGGLAMYIATFYVLIFFLTAIGGSTSDYGFMIFGVGFFILTAVLLTSTNTIRLSGKVSN